MADDTSVDDYQAQVQARIAAQSAGGDISSTGTQPVTASMPADATMSPDAYQAAVKQRIAAQADANGEASNFKPTQDSSTAAFLRGSTNGILGGWGDRALAGVYAATHAAPKDQPTSDVMMTPEQRTKFVGDNPQYANLPDSTQLWLRDDGSKSYQVVQKEAPKSNYDNYLDYSRKTAAYDANNHSVARGTGDAVGTGLDAALATELGVGPTLFGGLYGGSHALASTPDLTQSVGRDVANTAAGVGTGALFGGLTRGIAPVSRALGNTMENIGSAAYHLPFVGAPLKAMAGAIDNGVVNAAQTTANYVGQKAGNWLLDFAPTGRQVAGAVGAKAASEFIPESVMASLPQAAQYALSLAPPTAAAAAKILSYVNPQFLAGEASKASSEVLPLIKRVTGYGTD